jgi:HSP20 family protein
MLGFRMNRTDPLNQLRDEMSRVFEDFVRGAPLLNRLGLPAAGLFPAMNLWEDEQKLYAEAELPGFNLNDLEIFVVGNELTIKGERQEEHREKAAYHRRERTLGTFSRIVRLPIEIDADGVEATLKDGVLTITLPKSEQARPRKVQVKALTK